MGASGQCPALLTAIATFGTIWWWRLTLVKIEVGTKILEKIEKNDMFDSFPNDEDIEYELDMVSFNPT